MPTSPTPEVKVGQVWSDNDKRSEGRQIRIDHVGFNAADVTTVASPKTPNTVGRKTTVMLSRFKPTRQTGYTLVEDV